MIIKRILIIAPLLLTIFLLQSYFWVPTYEEQTKGNQERLQEYIEASIGDAAILNPILSADSASSQITSMVFEGLLDRDKDLRFRGRLATSWEIYEEAFFYWNRSSVVPGKGKLSAYELVSFLKKAKQTPFGKKNPALKTSLDNIRDISLLDPQVYEVTRKIKNNKAQLKEIRIRVKTPYRIKLTLSRVDQDLFDNLADLMGHSCFDSFKGERYISANPGINKEQLALLARELVPSREHNPCLIFHLRPGVRFHDGELFDANDVKFTFEAIMNPRNISPRLADYEPVKTIEVIDPLTIRIIYKRLYSPALGTWTMGILPEHLLNRETLKQESLRTGKDIDQFLMRQSSFNRHPVGCGPFMFQRWKADQYIKLVRFDKYWDGPANYKTYYYRIIPDNLTQEMEFYAGAIDSYGVQPHQVGRLENDPRFQSFSGASFGYSYIGYNLRRKPFNDPRVRRAMGMAIDVNKIIDYVLYGQGELISGPFVKQTDYYNQDLKPLKYDPQGALDLLAMAGWKKNQDGWLEKDGKKFEFTLITNSGNDIRKAILAICQDAWKKIGIDVRTDLLEWSVFIQERVDKADFDALILGWVMGIEPDLYQIWHSSQTNPYQLNFAGFKNLTADKLIIKIRQEYNHEKQVDYCHKLHEIIAREQPYTFLYAGKWTAILDKRIMIKDLDDQGKEQYSRIKPTKTGNFKFYFNKWLKVDKAHFVPEG